MEDTDSLPSVQLSPTLALKRSPTKQGATAGLDSRELEHGVAHKRPRGQPNSSSSFKSSLSPRHRHRSQKPRVEPSQSSNTDRRLDAILGKTDLSYMMTTTSKHGVSSEREAASLHTSSLVQSSPSGLKSKSSPTSVHIEYLHTPAAGRLNLGQHRKPREGFKAPPQQQQRADLDVRDRLRMASALNKLGINLGQDVIDQWMDHTDYNGVSFGSLAVLYEIKLAELLATIPRTVGRLPGNYPNKVRTALVLGIFKELTNSKALGKFRPMLQSVLSTVVDAIYVCSVREHPEGSRLSSTDYGQQDTWYELTRSQASRISALQDELKVADKMMKRFHAHRKLQKRILERVVERWKHALSSRVYNAWRSYWKEAKRVRQLIKMVMARRYFNRAREMKRLIWVAWKVYTRSVIDARLEAGGFDDLNDAESMQAEIEKLRENLSSAIALLRKSTANFRSQLEDLKVTFRAQLELALKSQATDLATAVDEAKAAGAKEGLSAIERRDVGSQVGLMVTHGVLADDMASKINNGKDETKSDEEIDDKEESAKKQKKKKKKKKPYKGRTLNMSKVLDTIAAMYEKKIKADAIDDKAGNKRDTLAEFAEDFFMQMYGTVMTKKKTAEFKHSVEVHKKDNIRIKWFSTLIGWNPPDAFGLPTPFMEDAIHAFLGVLMELFPVDAIEERLDDDPCIVNVTHALKALGTDGDGLFDASHRSTPSFSRLISNLRNNAKAVKGRNSSDRFIDFDLCMNLVMKEWYSVQNSRNKAKADDNDEKTGSDWVADASVSEGKEASESKDTQG